MAQPIEGLAASSHKHGNCFYGYPNRCAEHVLCWLQASQFVMPIAIHADLKADPSELSKWCALCSLTEQTLMLA